MIRKLNFPELVGIILGDGHIYHYPTHFIYGLEISGNALEDKEFFERIADYIERLIRKRPKIHVKSHKLGKSLQLLVYGKKFAYMLIGKGIPFKNKSFTAIIPHKYLPWRHSKHVLRGLFETDGSLYFSKLNGKHSYPRLEIKSSSNQLIKQIFSILSKQGYNPHIVTKKSDKTSAVYLSGSHQIDKWAKEIGFGSKKNLSKYLLWKKLGYYLPKSNLEERLKRLRSSSSKARGYPSG